MKAFWTILAIILGALALGGLVSLTKQFDPINLAIVILLALGAHGSWRQRKANSTSA